MNTTPWTPFPASENTEECNPSGWCVTDGVEVSPPGPCRAVFVVRKSGKAGIVASVPPEDAGDVAFATCGSDLIMTNGTFSAECFHPVLVKPHPRTAFGLADGGKTLVILAVDGRQEGYSEGATREDLARILRDEGVTDAVNMDGGGSTSLVIYDGSCGAPVMLNRHKGGKVRKNGFNFGITFGNGE